MKKSLKILCIADHVDPLVYSDAIKTRFSGVDAVISCGDLKPNYYEYIVSNLNIPFIYVLGNHSAFRLRADDTNPFGGEEHLFSGGRLADGKVLYINDLDLIVAGLGGSRRYNRGENQYTEAEMILRIAAMLPKLLWNRLRRGRFVDVLVTHAPPRHVGDREDRCHRGFRAFRWFLRRLRPYCMLHGHVHLYSNTVKRINTYEGVPVINAYKHFLLELPGEDSP